MNKKVLGVLFIIVAIASIVFAILSFEGFGGRSVGAKTYGGDAYTGIQNAAAQTATNVNSLNSTVQRIGGYAFILIGSILASIGVACLVGTKKKPMENPLEKRGVLLLNTENPGESITPSQKESKN